MSYSSNNVKNVAQDGGQA